MRYTQGYNSSRRQEKKGLLKGLFKRRNSSRLVVQKAEWGSARYTNPFAKAKKRHIRIPFKAIAVTGLFGGWIWLVLFNPYFRITKAEYSGLKIIKEAEIDTVVSNNFLKAHSWWPNNNYFLVSSKKVEEKLNDTYTLSSVTVEKKFPNTLNITLEEKISSVIYDNGSNYYLLDSNGTALKQITFNVPAASTTSAAVTTSTIITTSTPILSPSSTPKTEHQPDYKYLSIEYNHYPIIHDTRHMTIAEKQANILPSAFIRGVLDLVVGLRQAKVATVRYVTVEDVNAGVSVFSEKPWNIKMDAMQPIESQIQNVKTISASNKPTEYIDVRFGDRVYWK